MEEEENRDVDDEGGTVISRSSVVVNSKIVFSFCVNLAFNRLRWKIIHIDVSPCNLRQSLNKRQKQAGGQARLAMSRLVGC